MEELKSFMENVFYFILIVFIAGSLGVILKWDVDQCFLFGIGTAIFIFIVALIFKAIENSI